MKLFLLAVTAMISVSALADNYVHGHQKLNGTYVQGHYKTESNNTRNDNYSTRGNVNPYTGSKGYKSRDEDYGFGSGSRRRTKTGW